MPQAARVGTILYTSKPLERVSVHVPISASVLNT